MRILAYRTEASDGKINIHESSGAKTAFTNRLDTLFSFLLEPQGNSNWKPQHDRCIRVCWELDATVAPLLRLLGKEHCVKLKETNKCRQVWYEIFYIPGKVFSVTHTPTGARANFYDLQQYFPELDEPEDLLEVQMLGEKLLCELRKMGLQPTKLTSPVAIYEECVLKFLDLPQVTDMPQKAAEFAYRCSGRLWVEAHTIGHFNTAYDYDLTSAFPMIARDLVDIRCLNWMQSGKYQPKVVYGYIKCEVTIYDWVMVSPIMAESEDGSLFSPIGTWETYLTKSELDFIDKWKIGEYRIIDGWWGMRNGELPKLLDEPIDKLLAYKQATGLQSAMAKRMSVGIYGKMGEERKDSFGPYFNPCWFAEISIQVRLQVAEFLYSHNIGPGDNEGYKHLLHISIDGVLLDDDSKVKVNGNWRLSYAGEALVVSSGLVFFASRKPKGLNLDDVLGMIKEHPRIGYYEKRLKRRLTLADALARDQFEDLGKEVEMTSRIDLNQAKHDRKFKRQPKTGESLIKSKFHSVPLQTSS